MLVTMRESWMVTLPISFSLPGYVGQKIGRFVGETDLKMVVIRSMPGYHFALLNSYQKRARLHPMSEEQIAAELVLDGPKKHVREFFDSLSEEKLAAIKELIASLPPLTTAISIEDPLALGSRYQGAWNEQCTRIAARQEVIQIYLTASAVLFGFWVTAHVSDLKLPVPEIGRLKMDIDKLFTYGVTALTFFATFLVMIHNQVIQELTAFMATCEKHSKEVTGHGKHRDHLLHFCHPENPGVHQFHALHRLANRSIIALMFFATVFMAIKLTWEHPGLHSWACSGFAGFCVLALIYGLWDDFVHVVRQGITNCLRLHK